MPAHPHSFLMKAFLIVAPRWLLLAILVFAPWAYGCVRNWTMNVLTIAMASLLGLWLAGCVMRRTKPVVPVVVWVTAAFLLLQGWWMILNAQYYYDPGALKFVPIPSLWSFAPGVVDRVYSLPLMYRITGLLGILCFTCDLAQRAEWRRRIAWTICISGSALILFGLVERILGVHWFVWDGERVGVTSFASYFYHGNAGAFINLVLPLIGGFTLLAIGTSEENTQRSIWIPCFLIAVAGALAAVSKAAIVVTLVILAALLLLRGRVAVVIWKRLGSPLVRVAAVAAIVGVISALVWFGWDRMMTRWTQENWVSASYESRLLVYKACWSMRSDSGLWGFGPGNFRIILPFYTNDFGDKIAGFWRFAHEDYLQTLVEWGWIGASVWAVLFGGGIAAGFVSYWRRGALLARFDRMFLLTVVLALIGVALHSTVDFPLQIPSLQFYAAVYLGIAWGSRSWKETRKS